MEGVGLVFWHHERYLALGSVYGVLPDTNYMSSKRSVSLWRKRSQFIVKDVKSIESGHGKP